MKETIKAVITSKAHELTPAVLKAWAKNLVLFVAPTFATFFGLLAQGVEIEKAWPVAAFGLYQALSDLFRKWSAQTVEPVAK